MKIEDIVLKESRQLDITDNRNGLGQVPKNQDVDYFGLRVLMTPEKFLDLAKGGNRNDGGFIVSHLEEGGKIASPFLHIEIPESWYKERASTGNDDLDRIIGYTRDVAEVTDHEGRHRMRAVGEVYGNQPLEVHLFFTRDMKRRHIRDEWIQEMAEVLESESGRRISRPFLDVLN